MESLKPIFRLLPGLALLLSLGCSSHEVTLVNPQSGATAQCSGSGFGLGNLWVKNYIDDCIRQNENRGYLSVDKLTPQQRVDLQRRGLLP